MRPSSTPFRWWWRWLLAATSVILLVGAVLVFLPGLARTIFGWLFYGSRTALDEWSAEAVRYVTFAHGVLGTVMIGWGIALGVVLFGPLRQGEVQAWRTFTVSLSAWFVIDSTYSLWVGFWQNAVLNTLIVLLFVPGLVGIRRFCTDPSRQAANGPRGTR